MAASHKFGQRPPEISRKALALGWISGVRRIEFTSAKTSFWHRHAETTLLFCLKGEVVYEFHGLPNITLSAGSFLVIPAHVEHRHFGEVDPICRRVELLLDVRPLRPTRFSLFSDATAVALHAALLKHALRPVKGTKDVSAAFAELFDLAKDGFTSQADVQLGYVRLLLTRILYGTAAPATSHPEKDPPFVMDSVLKWIEAHYRERIDLDRLVAKTGFSRTHVFTLFKKHTGLTPSDYITRLRVRKACDALKDPQATSRAVAEACGFSSPSVFNAIFRRQTGLTPSQWRKKRSCRA